MIRLDPTSTLFPYTTLFRSKYKGEETWVEIGGGTIIREYCTINRGSTATGRTTVGARCFLMTYVHVAHDCVIGRSEEHTSELQSLTNLVCRLLLEKKKEIKQ